MNINLEKGGVILYKEPKENYPTEITIEEIEELVGHRVKIVKSK